MSIFRTAIFLVVFESWKQIERKYIHPSPGKYEHQGFAAHIGNSPDVLYSNYFPAPWITEWMAHMSWHPVHPVPCWSKWCCLRTREPDRNLIGTRKSHWQCSCIARRPGDHRSWHGHPTTAKIPSTARAPSGVCGYILLFIHAGECRLRLHGPSPCPQRAPPPCAANVHRRMTWTNVSYVWSPRYVAKNVWNPRNCGLRWQDLEVCSLPSKVMLMSYVRLWKLLWCNISCHYITSCVNASGFT